ncbi:AbrB/MazE/SpoVT family DNA-binding domain-containing protein (plasmid) [Rhizobium sp. WL3]|nr:AbrB/MazE/SpoVT family DNA-binding domain-containing protein [Rhizobium sp. WL3]
MRYIIPLQENGRMILPSDLRQALRLKKGDKVIIETQGNRIELTTPQRERRRAQEMFRRFVPAGQQLVDEVIDERRQEAMREEEEALNRAENLSGMKR